MLKKNVKEPNCELLVELIEDTKANALERMIRQVNNNFALINEYFRNKMGMKLNEKIFYKKDNELFSFGQYKINNLGIICDIVAVLTPAGLIFVEHNADLWGMKGTSPEKIVSVIRFEYLSSSIRNNIVCELSSMIDYFGTVVEQIYKTEKETNGILLNLQKELSC